MHVHDDATHAAVAPKGAAEAPGMAPVPASRAIGLPSRNGGFAVRPSLTAKPASSDGPVHTRPTRSRGRRRARVAREAQDLEAMVMRMMRALRQRAEGGDLEALVALVNLEPWCRAQQRLAARALTGEGGYSWAQLALRLGITKQSAHGRWGGE